MNFGLFVQQLLLFTSGLRLSHQVYERLHKHVKHFAPSRNTEELCSCAITQPKIKLLFHFARTSPSRQVVNESLNGLQNVAELLQIYFSSSEGKGTAIAQWLRCCATNRKVAGSIPAGVIGFFIDIKSFPSHYGPGADSASNRNEYQEYFLGVKAAGA